MDYQEKLRLAKKALDSGSYDKETIEYIFPELKESEDERIRKSLIGHLKECRNNTRSEVMIGEYAKWITWLEKQTIDISFFPEEQRKYIEKYVNLDKTTLVKLLAERDENVNEILNCEKNEIKPKFKVDDVISDGSSTVIINGINENGYIISNGETENDSNAVNWIIHFEDQDKWKLLEQDKVEPKFRVGDWVVYDGVTYLITGVYTDGYTNDHQGFIPLKHQDEMRLWNFSKDAKNGDVLYTSSTASHEIFIFKGLSKEGHIECYCSYDSEDKYCDGKYHFIGKPTFKTHPATKEQCDLLFSKMKEAGYEWDAENKELKKI